MSSDETSGSQRAIKRPRVPPGPLADLKELLYQLYLEAGTPRVKQIAEWAAIAEQAGMPGPDTVARIIGSATMPPSQADLMTVVTVLARAARWDDPDDAVRRARDMWVAAGMDSARAPAGGMRVSQVDPRRLGVHAVISVPGVADEVPPEYVPRDADDGEFGLRAKVAAAAERGGFVLLVGGSSVGKTRCAFEAVKALLPDWWLTHPADPAGVAALAAAPVPQTVVWLDELQRYLDGEQGLAGGVVRALLNVSGPVVIIATIWPERYTAYTAVPVSGGSDLHERERQVLDLADVIRVAAEFSPAERDRAQAAAARDRRLAIALGTAGYGLTQTLAAAPQLVARWENANPYAWAVLTAALDATRLGVRAPLSAGFLCAAAPDYCTRQQKADAPENWFEQALAYATGKLHGAAAALSPVGTSMGHVTGYLAADYLVQHASRQRRYERVPGSTWDAVLSHLRDPADSARLADSARNRMLYRYAIPLYRHAVRAGDEHAALRLAELLTERGDLDGAAQILRARADAGDGVAAERLAELLAERGDLDGAAQFLRARADAGDWAAAWRLAQLFKERGDVDGLRTRADVGDWPASERLAELLAERGDLDGAAQILRGRVDAGEEYAAVRLAELLAERGDLDGAAQLLRAQADDGDEAAAARLPELLAERGDLDGAAQILSARTHYGVQDAAGFAAMLLAELLAGRGDLDGAAQILSAWADADDGAAARYAAWRLAKLLKERGDLDGLRTRADADDAAAARYAAWRLAQLLKERGDLDGLRTRADAGDAAAAGWLAELLAERGDLDGAAQTLRALANDGDWAAARRLAELLEQRGDLDGAAQTLRAWADADDEYASRYAAERLAELLEQRGDLDGAAQTLRASANAGDWAAAGRLAQLLKERGDLDGLRARADAGDWAAAGWLAELLVERRDLDGLRARADAGDRAAAGRLAELLTLQGSDEEAEQLRRFGLNADGTIART